MKWIEIDPANLPEGEVLAACFDKESSLRESKFCGILKYYSDLGIVCENEFDMFDTLENVTHYIPIPEFEEE